MKKNEGKTTDWSTKQSIVFGLFFSGFKISFLLLLLVYSDVMETISCFTSYLCLFVKTNRGRYMLCLCFQFV